MTCTGAGIPGAGIPGVGMPDVGMPDVGMAGQLVVPERECPEGTGTLGRRRSHRASSRLDLVQTWILASA